MSKNTQKQLAKNLLEWLPSLNKPKKKIKVDYKKDIISRKTNIS